MNIVADENITRLMVTRLRAEGHTIRFILDERRGINDQAVLPLAAEAGALLLTWDKDFRQLVIEARRPSAGVLLLRMGNLRLEEQSNRVIQTLQEYGEQLHHLFSTLYADHMDMEPLPEEKN